MTTAMRTVCIGFLSLATLSCSSVAPMKVTAGDQCFRCRRTISEVRVATEMITGDHEYFVSKFRGPGCMAKYIASHPDPTATVFVTDYPTGKMIASRDAFYVPVVVDRKTNEIDYRAYERRPEAAAAAFELRTTAIRWDAVLDKAH